MSWSCATDLQDYERRERSEQVTTIIEAVRRRGDDAVREFCRREDGVARARFAVSEEEIQRCFDEIPDIVLDDIRSVQRDARRFAEAQLASIRDIEVESDPGVRYGFHHVPVGAAAVCAGDPVGPAPAPVQTSVVAAKAAGVARIAACAPLVQRRLPALLIAALRLAGADEIYALGGVHGLAALALGTESIDRVEVVVGSGDATMAEANRQLFGARAVELAAAPGEILIVADDSADPELIAADVVGVIECDADARAVVITTSPALAARVPGAVERCLDSLPARRVAELAWHRYGAVNVVDDREAACALADRYAFDRVEILAADPRWYLGRVRRCGTVQLGPWASPAFAGETAGQAARQVHRRAAHRGQLPVTSFLSTVAYHECVGPDSTRVANDAFARQRRLAGFEAHARACELRTAAPSSGADPQVAALRAG